MEKWCKKGETKYEQIAENCRQEKRNGQFTIKLPTVSYNSRGNYVKKKKK